MKKLFIRFFDNSENKVPVDSHEVIPPVVKTMRDLDIHSNEIVSEMIHWMLRYPDGKVDFVWL